MNVRGGSRMWLVGGAVAIVVLIVATYLLAIKPVYAETETIRAQADDQQLESDKLDRKLRDLRKQYEQRGTYAAQLKAKRLNLPNNYDIPNYLRQLQVSDNAVVVNNDSISVADPIAVPGIANVVGVPITLAAKGEVPALIRFIDRLQNTQSRAVLVTSADVRSEADNEKPTLSVALTAFCSKEDDSDCRTNT
jgi:Tfp pilus assembly protein PilO